MGKWVTVEISYTDIELLKNNLAFPLMAYLRKTKKINRYFFQVVEKRYLVINLELMFSELRSQVDELICAPIADFLSKNTSKRKEIVDTKFVIEDKRTLNSFRVLDYEKSREHFLNENAITAHEQILCQISEAIYSLYLEEGNEDFEKNRSNLGLQCIMVIAATNLTNFENLSELIFEKIRECIKFSHIPSSPKFVVNHYAYRFKTIFSSFNDSFDVNGEKYLKFLDELFESIQKDEKFDDPWFDNYIECITSLNGFIKAHFSLEEKTTVAFKYYWNYIIELLGLEKVDVAWIHYLVLKYLARKYEKSGMCFGLEEISVDEEINRVQN